MEGKGRDQQVGYDGQGARHSRAKHRHDARACRGVSGTEGSAVNVRAGCSPSLHAPLAPHLCAPRAAHWSGGAAMALAYHACWPTRMLPSYHARGASSCAWGLSASLPARLTQQQLPGVPQHVWRRRPLQAGQGAHGARALLLRITCCRWGRDARQARRSPELAGIRQMPPPPNSPTPSLPGR